MTRENKLALVVGFGLLLFVGILVSDHFSAAHRQESAAFGLAASPPGRSGRPISIAPMPAASVAALQPSSQVMASGDVQRTAGVTPISSAPQRVEPTVMQVATEPVAETRRVATVQQSEPGVRLHPIAEGETLFAICKREYGDGSLANALAKYNAKAIPNPNRMRKGVTIRIPPVETLRPGSAKQARASAAASEDQPSVTAIAAAETVVLDSRVPIGGEVTVEMQPPAAAPAKQAAKSPAKSATKSTSKKPAKKPVASKSGGA